MKHIGKILPALAILASISITYSADLWAEKIEAKDKNTIELQLTGEIALPLWEIDAEIAVLSDTAIRGAVKMADSTKKVEILLEDEILPNTNYSLLTVQGSEGTIDFITPSIVEWYSVAGTNGIGFLEVVDAHTLRIEYLQDVTANGFEFKILSESKVTKVEKLDPATNKLTLTVNPDLESEKDYILMMVDMHDVTGNLVSFDGWIYDFKTPLFEQILWDTSSGALVAENTASWAAISENLDAGIELNAAPEVSLEKEGTSTGIVTTQAAQMVTATPDTGAETWVLVVLTLIINTFFYFTRKKQSLAV